MPILTHPIETAINAARIMAGVLFFVGVAALLFAFVTLANIPSRPDSWKLLAAIAVIVVLLYFLPGVLMLLLAWRMASAAKWPFVSAMVLAGVAVLGLTAQTLKSSAGGNGLEMAAGGCVELVSGAPAIYLLVRCWNALPELRFVRDQPAPRRGFEPIMPSGPATPDGLKSQAPPPQKPAPRLPPRPNLPGRSGRS